MDYQRIYDAFIASRKEAETTLNGYVERHHITPRSFGGPDDPDNLVKLTPEDHFFAHLLLAKIHGGKMSAALYCMMQVAPNHWGRRMHSRGRYGLAKRLAIPALREAFSGANNPLYNPTMFECVDGDCVVSQIGRITRRFLVLGLGRKGRSFGLSAATRLQRGSAVMLLSLSAYRQRALAPLYRRSGRAP